MMPGVFAQGLAEYGGLSGVSGLRESMDRVVLALSEMTDLTWGLIGGAALLLFVFLGRRSRVR